MLQYLYEPIVFYPAALLCFLPVCHQLRFSKRNTALLVCLSMIATSFLVAWIRYRFRIEEDLVMLVLFPLFFVAYHLCLKVRLCQSVAVFLTVLSVFAILSNGVSCFFAALFGDLSFGADYALVSAAVCCLFAALLTYPFVKYGSFLIDRIDYASIWITASLFSACIFVFSMLLKPILQDPGLFETPIYYGLFSQVVLLISWLGMCVAFYFAVQEVLKRKSVETQNRMLAMRELQFDSQQQYIKASERTRHDFRQNVRTMRELYDAGEMNALGQYLHEYEQNLPSNEIVSYTEHAPLNALLNYYQHVCKQNEIRFTVQIRLPAVLSVSDVDLCTAIGNILDNAVMACLTTDDRFIDLTVLTENDAQLFIVATNSFDGKARKKDQQYLSTKHSGKAIGLASIATTVEAYGGLAQFSHEGDRFFSNIAIPLSHEAQQTDA